MALVKDVMKTNLVTASPDESVAVVSRRMKENHLGAVLVMLSGKMVGIFTERDILNRVVAEGRNADQVRVEEVCTLNPVAVKASTAMKACAAILRKQGFRHLPVVDDAEQPIGIVSSRDFFQFMTDELEHVIDTFRKSGEKVEESFDPYEYLGAGGVGLPGTPE